MQCAACVALCASVCACAPCVLPILQGAFAEFTGIEQAKPDESMSATAAAGGGKKGRTPLAIIIEPSKELAQQVVDQIIHFKKHLPAPALREILLMVRHKTEMHCVCVLCRYRLLGVVLPPRLLPQRRASVGSVCLR